MCVSFRAGVPVDSPVSGTWDNAKNKSMSHSRAARALGGGGKGGGDEADEEDEIDSGSDDDEQRVVPHPLMEDEARETLDFQSDLPSSEQSPPGVSTPVSAGNKGKFKSMMYNVAKRMANTKIVQRAKEKVSSYPLVLTVEVIKLDGVLAVNIPPPLTDTIW